MFKKKIMILVIAVSAVLLSGCLDIFNKGPVDGREVIFNSANGKVTFKVEVADSFEERKTGLMNRNSLDQDRGMFFIFDKSEVLHFWMKNTLIPLDIVYIGDNFKVVSITKNAQPCKTDPCKVYDSGRSARYVLEINGGLADKNGIKTGDSVEYKK
jgi:uncharacterized membrane protein (UPF0127 family)